MRALGASERVMDIITSAEVPTLTDAAANSADGAAAASANLEIAGGKALPRMVAGRVVFKVQVAAEVGGEGVLDIMHGYSRMAIRPSVGGGGGRAQQGLAGGGSVAATAVSSSGILRAVGLFCFG